ncbi:MAG TPA: DoxX family protein [Chthoniobacterales bacterium]|nr:DoxX family protein [Chthoniobacterales bacterium]
MDLKRWTPYALSALRFFAGLTFFQHGTHKYFNFPPGQSYQGINLATMQGWAGTIELVAGALILLGLLTRPAAFVAAGEMAVGYFMVHAPQSFFTARNGGENAYLFCFVFLFLVFAGPGPISLDRWIWGRRGSRGD